MVGGYELVSCIGEGASGPVWRAIRPGPVGGEVAVKRTRVVGEGAVDVAAARARLVAEASILAALDHPHIVRVFDVLEDGASVAIVMQLAHGGSLQTLLDRRGCLPAGEVVAVAAPVAEALASAHRRGLVHGDVKPGNILFTTDGEPLLSDFGAARHFGPTPALSGSSPAARWAGTAPYLDPDVLLGAAPGPASDVYALGVVCHEALSGGVPHTADAAAAGAGEPHPVLALDAVPERLARLIVRAISPDPRERPGGLEFARELRTSIAPVSACLPAMPPPSTTAPVPTSSAVGRRDTREFGPRPPATPRHPSSRAKSGGRRQVVMLSAAAAAAAVALGGTAAVWLGHGGSHRAPRTTGAAAGRPPAGRRPRCPAFPKLGGAPDVSQYAVDLHGDGCPVPVAWDGRVLTARFAPHDRSPRYYEVGLRGDVLLFGDWNCDGAQSPALYRPALGQVLYVNSFAGRIGDRTYADRISRGLLRNGSARVVQAPDGCETVRVG